MRQLALVVLLAFPGFVTAAGIGEVSAAPTLGQITRGSLDVKWSEGAEDCKTGSPQELIQVELGDRTIDVIPTPGHNATHVVFYDRDTGLLFSGDFLLPGRLLVADVDAYIASAQRIVDFVRTRPVTHVLGAHIEMNAEEELFPWKTTYHPNERPLPLTKEDLLSLPATLLSLEGLYAKHGKWVLMRIPDSN